MCRCFQRMNEDMKLYSRIVAKHSRMRKKITFLLQKMGTEEDTKYFNLILSPKTEEVLFPETIDTVVKIFDECDSVFYAMYKCINRE